MNRHNQPEPIAQGPANLHGEMRYLIAGSQMVLRLWDSVPAQEPFETTTEQQESVGYAIGGKARLELEGETFVLEPGDGWVVPAGAEHRYVILETFSAIEVVTAPPNLPAFLEESLSQHKR